MRVEFDLGRGRAEGAAPVHLSIGNFDGVHRGHQELLRRLVRGAHEDGGDAIVLTFEPHPRCVLDPDTCPPEITTLEEKRELLQAQGLDRLVVLAFTRELSRWSAQQFCARLLESFALRRLIVGPDFALGHRRQGDVAFLRSLGSERGFDVDVVEPLLGECEPISSSRVRIALLDGDITTANALLGRAHFADGWVEHGDGRGSRIGYPTANLSIAPNKCLPERGVYATWVKVRGRWFAAATNIGYRPTFGGDRLTVEAFLLGFAEDIYRQHVRLAFIARLRDEVAYPDAAALTEQIGRDVEETRRLLTDLAAPRGL